MRKSRSSHLTPRDHLQRLWVMRNLALIGQASVIAITEWGLHIALPLAPISAIVMLLGIFNGVTWLRLRRVQTVTILEIFGQFLLDLVALSLLLYFTGGATNPFVSFYLPILAVAAAALPGAYVWLLSGFSLAGYTVLGFFYMPLVVSSTSPMLLGGAMAHGSSLPVDYHLLGMWANFVIGASWIAWFVLQMSNDLRERDAALSSARQRLLQDARVVALAAQAARTAHELGTPLSSIAVAAGELSAALASDPLLERYRPDITTIESQLDACRRALYGLKEESPLDEHDVVSLNEWLPQFFYQWRLSHPATRLEVQLVVQDTACEGAVLLGQVLTIVLDNAARASEAVQLEAVAANRLLTVTIDDHGEGLPAGLLDAIGSAPVTSRSGGRGWGLFLAFTAVEARAGKIRLTGRPEGGTRVVIQWPLPLGPHADQQPSNLLTEFK
jgi:two-component system sensor histidine kinase RegB